MYRSPIGRVIYTATTPWNDMVYIIIFNFKYWFSAEITVRNFHLDLQFAHLLEIFLTHFHQNSPTIPVLNAATITATISPHNSQYTFLFFVARVISHFQNLYLQFLCSVIHNPCSNKFQLCLYIAQRCLYFRKD